MKCIRQLRCSNQNEGIRLNQMIHTMSEECDVCSFAYEPPDSLTNATFWMVRLWGGEQRIGGDWKDSFNLAEEIVRVVAVCPSSSGLVLATKVFRFRPVACIVIALLCKVVVELYYPSSCCLTGIGTCCHLVVMLWFLVLSCPC